jgi:hypothetical protein
MKVIKVDNCQNCPFVNNDTEYGYDGCGLKEIKLIMWEQMPIDKVRKECPLNNDDFIIKKD